MSFTENENRTCRTIMATRSAISRESLIYKSEYNRHGNGEYRIPTIREIASLMGFPYAYQFVGSEGLKWKQIGNSVCPQMSAALAKALRKKMEFSEIKLEKLDFSSLKENYTKVKNLNTFTEKQFISPAKRKNNARFRRHPFKIGNMTVDLMNYHPNLKDTIGKKWYVSVFFGTGDYSVRVLQKEDLKKIEKVLSSNFSKFLTFKKNISVKPYPSEHIQKIFEEDLLLNNKNNPLKVIKKMAKTIQTYDNCTKYIEVEDLFPRKKIPMAQLMAMYGLTSLYYREIGL